MLLSFDQFLLVIVAVAIITAIFLTSESKRRREEYPASLNPQYNRDENISESANPEFAALIKAIREEGRAYRKEEYSEDDRKTVVDFLNTLFLILTFCVLTYTCYAIIQQVAEMQKAYPEIHRQAQAAIDQASAAKIQADTAKTQADAARDAAIAANRAWVGPSGATMDGVPAKGADIKIHIAYQNTGREPARGFGPKLDPFIATGAEMANGTTGFRITHNLDTCRLSKPVAGTQVVYPTTGLSSSSQNVTIDKGGIDDQLLSGASIIIVVGCFSYETFGESHYSAFCFYYRKDFTPLPSLNFCEGGSDAN